MDFKTLRNWRVRVYRFNAATGKETVRASWIINNRTEYEASKEAEADIGRMADVDDWTMTAI